VTIARIRQESSEGEGVACMTDYLKQQNYGMFLLVRIRSLRWPWLRGVFDLVSKHTSMNEGQMGQKQVSHSSHSLMMMKKCTKNFLFGRNVCLKNQCELQIIHRKN
jgi:hypothetical protein